MNETVHILTGVMQSKRKLEDMSVYTQLMPLKMHTEINEGK